MNAWGDYRKDAKLCQDLRKHVGDDIDLMYDGSAGFDLVESLSDAKAVAPELAASREFCATQAMYLNSATGAYEFVADNAAVNALQVGDNPTVSFTFCR